MSEPKRLLEGEGASRLLIASMQGDRLDGDAKQRMRAALGLGVGAMPLAASTIKTDTTVATKSLTPAAAKSATVGVVKWVGLLALGGTAIAGAWSVAKTETPRPATLASSTSSSSVAPPPVQREEPRAADEARAAITTEGVTEASARPITTAPAPVRSGTSTPQSHASSGADLTEELRLLEVARGRLRSGDAAGALSSLERYRQSAPNGVLRVEAKVLEIETLIALGRRDEAVKQGRAILARHPEGPLSDRVRRLIGD